MAFAASSANPYRVRDAAASVPDSGSSAAMSDSLPHATSRTRFTSDRPVTTLPGVQVDAEIERARRAMPTAFVTELRLDRSSRTLASLADALVEVAGVRVVQYGGLGSFSTMSLRGAPPGQVTVLLDGVPLSSAAHGVVDLSDLPASAIERIEVYRGVSPFSLGLPTPGGAVNLVTRAGASTRRARITGGSFATGEARATWGAARGAWSLLAHGGWQGSEGDFPYFDDNATPFNPDDDSISTRRNNRFDASTALVRVGWTPSSRLRGSARFETFHRAQGVPGLGNTPALAPRLAFDRVLAVSDWAFEHSDRVPRATLRAHLDRERSRFRDTEGQLGLGRQETDEHFRGEGVSSDLTSPSRWRFSGASVGGALRHEWAAPAPPTSGQPVPPTSRRQTRAAWASVQLHDPGERLLVSAGRRWDEQLDHVRFTATGGTPTALDTRRTLDAPQLGARARVPFALELRANWTRAPRAPGFTELFGNQGSVLGNPRLLPEHGESWDAGASWAGVRGAARATIEWAHHASHLEQMIVFQRLSQSSVRAENVARAELAGDDVTARAAWRGFDVAASASWLQAHDTGAGLYRGRRLPQRPQRQGYARLSWRVASFALSAEVEYLGENWLDRINRNLAPSRSLVSIALGRDIGALRATLEGRNLGDVLAQDVAGFPLPGRSVFASIEARFGETPSPH